MKHVKGYRIIELPLSESTGEAVHSLYIKEHSSRDSSSNSSKVLFVGNVNYRINMSDSDIEAYLNLIFSRFGDIASISVSKFGAEARESSADTAFAHVSFNKKSSIKFALGGADSDYNIAVGEVVRRWGVEFARKSGGQIRGMFAFMDEDAEALQVRTYIHTYIHR
jgi:hypothetical protein